MKLSTLKTTLELTHKSANIRAYGNNSLMINDNIILNVTDDDSYIVRHRTAELKFKDNQRKEMNVFIKLVIDHAVKYIPEVNL